MGPAASEEDKAIYAEMKLKGEAEFGQLPVMQINGKWYSQSISIMRMLGAQHGLYDPSDADKAWRIDSIIDSC